jgi:hypothetical protein
MAEKGQAKARGSGVQIRNPALVDEYVVLEDLLLP